MKKAISLILNISAIVYTLWYMHYGVPYKNSGALSKIGLEHRGAFIIWGAITFAALAFSIILAYGKYAKYRFHLPLLALSFVGMLLTLCFKFDYDIKPDYYFHCIGSLAFSVSTSTTVFLLFLMNYKKALIFKAFTYVTAAILLIDLACLFVFKETGLIETLPVIAGLILLSITNLRREKIEAARNA